jgi:predicted butyrate kinase (DUF1464 family)
MPNNKGFEISGIEKIQKNFKLLENGFLNAIEKTILKSVIKIEADAKQLAPVITGRLARSGTSGIIEKTMETVIGMVGFNTVYAGTVENTRPGPGKKSGQRPYLRPAIDKNLPQIEKEIIESLKKTISGFKIKEE